MMKQLRMMTACLLAVGLCCTAALCTACANTTDSDSVHSREDRDPDRSIYVPEVPESRVSEDVPGDELTGAIGETVQYQDKLEVTLDRVVELDAIDKSVYRVLLAEMTISNRSSEKIDCSTLTHFSIIIDGEEKTEPLRDVQASVPGRKYYTKINSDLLPFNQEISGGETLKGYVYIYAPTAWTDMQLVYTPYKYYSNDHIILDIDEGQLTHYAEQLG